MESGFVLGLQILQTVVVVAGVGFAVLQLRNVRMDRQLMAINAMFTDFHHEVAYERRYRVLPEPSPDMGGLTESEYLDRMQIADFYQRIGYLCRRGFLSQEHVLEMYSGAIIRMWVALEPYVRMRRAIEHLDGYSRDFEALAKAARAYAVKPK